MPDLLLTALEYFGWAVFFLFILFGLFGVAAFLGLKQFEPEDDDGMVKEDAMLPTESADQGHVKIAPRDRPVTAASGE